jgi:DNA invertase Pin-like site-specific DNA recombinase
MAGLGLQPQLIIERTQAGLESARFRGRSGGRPRKMDEPKIRTAMAALSDRKSIAADVARTLGVTTSNPLQACECRRNA